MSFKLLSQNANSVNGHLYLGRILPIIVNLCPQRDSPEFQTITRPNGTVIELGYAVKKRFADEKRVIHLQEIYGLLCVSKKLFKPLFFLKVYSDTIYNI